jgi:hypothetical protein
MGLPGAETAHHLEAAAAVSGIIINDRRGIGRRRFQLGAMFGVGRSGGMPNAILISLTSEEGARRGAFVRLHLCCA